MALLSPAVNDKRNNDSGCFEYIMHRLGQCTALQAVLSALSTSTNSEWRPIDLYLIWRPSTNPLGFYFRR